MLLLALIALAGLASAGSLPGIDWRVDLSDGFVRNETLSIEFCFSDKRQAPKSLGGWSLKLLAGRHRSTVSTVFAQSPDDPACWRVYDAKLSGAFKTCPDAHFKLIRPRCWRPFCRQYAPSPSFPLFDDLETGRFRSPDEKFCAHAMSKKQESRNTVLAMLKSRKYGPDADVLKLCTPVVDVKIMQTVYAYRRDQLSKHTVWNAYLIAWTLKNKKLLALADQYTDPSMRPSETDRKLLEASRNHNVGVVESILSGNESSVPALYTAVFNAYRAQMIPNMLKYEKEFKSIAGMLRDRLKPDVAAYMVEAYGSQKAIQEHGTLTFRRQDAPEIIATGFSEKAARKLAVAAWRAIKFARYTASYLRKERVMWELQFQKFIPPESLLWMTPVYYKYFDLADYERILAVYDSIASRQIPIRIVAPVSLPVDIQAFTMNMPEAPICIPQKEVTKIFPTIKKEWKGLEAARIILHELTHHYGTMDIQYEFGHHHDLRNVSQAVTSYSSRFKTASYNKCVNGRGWFRKLIRPLWRFFGRCVHPSGLNADSLAWFSTEIIKEAKSDQYRNRKQRFKDGKLTMERVEGNQ